MVDDRHRGPTEAVPTLASTPFPTENDMEATLIDSNVRRAGILACTAVFAAGCATWSHTTVDNPSRPAAAAAVAPTPVAQIVVMEADSPRKYTSLGDITVTVNKTTAFHPAPTRELVNQALKEKAAEMGADAVVLVRYGTVGVSLMSWGSLEGKGRAVKYAQ